jgi:drug/metabolite transporter superfamily protein YnfA
MEWVMQRYKFYGILLYLSLVWKEVYARFRIDSNDIKRGNLVCMRII